MDKKKVKSITHPGVIEAIEAEKITVKILSKSMCASCHAKGACTMADMEEKTIDVYNFSDTTYEKGQSVEVIMKKSMGPKAVLIGYFYPFLLVLIGLIVFVNIFPSEGLAGLLSLALLVPYYGLIYSLRERLKKKFVFSIKS
ncbi:MAG: SoxR reducing system RseC family protein [Hyphomicrobiales bacterium]